MTVRVLSQVGPSWAARVADAVPDVEVEDLPGEGPVPDGTSGDVLFTWGWPNTPEVARSAGVRWIHFAGTGIDRHPMDDLAGFVLTCSRGVSGVPISEFVLMSMLGFVKQAPDVWISEPPEMWNVSFRLGELAGATLGLVGLGGIGIEIARRALAFDMEVRAVRHSDTPSPLDGVTLVPSLDDVLPHADHLVLACPLTPDTRHLIDAQALGAVKPGVHLVNIARGGLVDQDALRIALDDGTVARASLDTVEPEPLPIGHWLFEHPLVHLSPHVSWSSPRTTERVVGRFVDNLRRYRSGAPLVGEITDAGY